MLVFFILLGVLVAISAALWLWGVRVEITLIVSLDPTRRTVVAEVVPLGRPRWKRQVQIEADPGQLIAVLLQTISQKQQRLEPPRWLGRLSAAQKLHMALKLLPVARRWLQYLTIKNLEWRTTYGGEDAMFTGMVTGGIWACKGSFISIISSVCSLEHMHIDVEPDFSRPRLWSRFSGIFRMRAAHIIFISIDILLWMVRGYWIGRTTGKPAKPPHRGVNENCYAEY